MTRSQWDKRVMEETLAKMWTYNPGQLAVPAKYLPHAPKWFVIGGPSCADECQTARRLWPAVRVLACEPSGIMRVWQERHGFDGVMLDCAVSSEVGVVEFRSVNGPSGGTIQPGFEDRPVSMVLATTLDSLDAEYGPFEDVFLWLDIEGAELRALQGGVGLLGSGRVIAVNLEFCHREEATLNMIRELLTSHGFVEALDWNRASGSYHDELWVRT